MSVVILILSSNLFYHPSIEEYPKDVLFTKQEMIKEFNFNVQKTSLNENSRTIKVAHKLWDKSLTDN